MSDLEDLSNLPFFQVDDLNSTLSIEPNIVPGHENILDLIFPGQSSQYNNEILRLVSLLLPQPNLDVFLFPQLSDTNQTLDDLFSRSISWPVEYDSSVPSSNQKFNIQLKSEKYTGNDCLCSLCLDDIKNDADIYKLPCNHIFHAHNCLENTNIMNWIEKHKTCPYCRGKVNAYDTQNEEGLDPEEIELVISQATTSREKAIAALRKHRNVVDAILECID